LNTDYIVLATAYDSINLSITGGNITYTRNKGPVTGGSICSTTSYYRVFAYSSTAITANNSAVIARSCIAVTSTNNTE